MIWILLCGVRQSHLLLGHHVLVHTSSLRLSSQRLALSLTAFLRQVVGFPHRGLLRRLRPLSDIGRRLTDSVARETDRVPRFTWGASTHGHRFCLTPGSARCLARDRGNQGVIGVLISYHYEITLACWRQAFRPLHPRPTSTDGPSYGASNSSFLRNHNRILASSSQSGRPLLSHIVEGASDPRLPRVRVPVPLATLFTPRVPSWELSPRAPPGAHK